MELQKNKKEAEKAENHNGKVDFEELLDHIGGWGNFQIRLTAIFVYFTFFLAYVGYTPILYLYTPDHWCKIPEGIGEQLIDLMPNISEKSLMDVLIPKEKDGKRSQCEMYNVTDFIEGSMPRRIGCIYGYEYNYTEYFKSATSQFDWVCQDEWKPAFTQSMFFAGAIIGNLAFFSFLRNFPIFQNSAYSQHTFRNQHFFVQKLNFNFLRNCRFFLGEKLVNCCGFGLFSC